MSERMSEPEIGCTLVRLRQRTGEHLSLSFSLYFRAIATFQLPLSRARSSISISSLPFPHCSLRRARLLVFASDVCAVLNAEAQHSNAVAHFSPQREREREREREEFRVSECNS